jgi:ribose/xylose/arabinose/galactoside ABC-type transport system permease subunit
LINAGLPGPPAIIFAILAMALVGFVNGWLIAYVEIPAMLATLASAMLGCVDEISTGYVFGIPRLNQA